MPHALKLDEIINVPALNARLDELAPAIGGAVDAITLRPKVVEIFKETLAYGRHKAEAMLLKDGGVAMALIARYRKGLVPRQQRHQAVGRIFFNGLVDLARIPH